MSTNDGEDPSIHFCREVRLSYGPRKKAEVLGGAQAAYELARKIVPAGADREHFGAIYVDAKQAPLAWRIVSIGTVSSCLVHPREVFRPAVNVGASGVIVFHNHPSGQPEPSIEDDTVTRRLVSAGELLGLPLLDHLVLGEGAFVSYAERGRLRPSS